MSGPDDEPATFTVRAEDMTAPARIREAALVLFGQHGFKATSMRQIADAAGVSLGNVVHHFKSKEEIARAVQRVVMDKLRAAVSGVGIGEPPLEAARLRHQAYARYLKENPAFAAYKRTMYWEAGPAGVELFREALTLSSTEMHAMVEAGMARPLPDEQIGIIAYMSLSNATILLGPIIEATLGLDPSDAPVSDRFREAIIDLLSEPVLLRAERGQPSGK